MYEVFYNFQAEPFRLSPDHRFCYEHKGYARARAYMAYAFMRAEGFVMITGRPGTGKTTLVGELVENLARDNVSAANLVCTQLQADDLLKTVAYNFGVNAEGADKAELLQRLNRLLHRWHREGRRALLIVDEAQDLSPSAMEELRLLTNIQIDGQPLLQIFLLGQPELRELVLSPGMEQVHQRIVAASHLEGLEPDEVEAYVLHRLKRVGWRGDPVISKAVFPLLHKFSEGVPRRINLICSRLFLHCGVEQRHAIDLDDLKVVITELQQENLAAGSRMTPDDFLRLGEPGWSGAGDTAGESAAAAGAMPEAGAEPQTEAREGGHLRAVGAEPFTAPEPEPAAAGMAPAKKKEDTSTPLNESPAAGSEAPPETGAVSSLAAAGRRDPVAAPGTTAQRPRPATPPGYSAASSEGEERLWPMRNAAASAQRASADVAAQPRGREPSVSPGNERPPARRPGRRRRPVIAAVTFALLLLGAAAGYLYLSGPTPESPVWSGVSEPVAPIGDIAPGISGSDEAPASAAATAGPEPRSEDEIPAAARPGASFAGGAGAPRQPSGFVAEPPEVVESGAGQAAPAADTAAATPVARAAGEEPEATADESPDGTVAGELDTAGKLTMLVGFPFDSAQLDREARFVLDEVVDILGRNAESTARISGFTDSMGDASYNLVLSQERAIEVERYLIEAGIERDRLQVEGRGVLPGPSLPLAGDSSDDREKYRIVKIQIDRNGST